MNCEPVEGETGKKGRGNGVFAFFLCGGGFEAQIKLEEMTGQVALGGRGAGLCGASEGERSRKDRN